MDGSVVFIPSVRALFRVMSNDVRVEERLCGCALCILVSAIVVSTSV